ncbi:MAG: hypothetical protein IPK83_09595 [Planctomycetes bacterium]|nr:hypothetical protein [Planctomycetota bacterium]
MLSDVVPFDTFQGTNLQLMMDEHAIADHRIFSQGNMWGPELQALRLDGYKVIQKNIGREAYEVRVDPKESRNLARESEFVKLCDELQKKLKEFSIRLGNKPGVPVALTAEEQKGLNDLGYTSKGRSESELSSTQPATQPSTQDSKSAP